MLKRIGPFLLVPFLVSDWTDNQWQSLCLNENASVLSAKVEIYPLATQWRQQLLQKIQTPPLICHGLPAGASALSALAQLPSHAHQRSWPVPAADPLYELMS